MHLKQAIAASENRLGKPILRYFIEVEFTLF